MTREQLNERIQKANDKIRKKEQLIEKRRKAIEKKYSILKKLGIVEPEKNEVDDFRYLEDENMELWNDVYWVWFDIYDYKESIKNAMQAIEEIEETLSKYNAQMDKLNESEKAHKEMPEVLRKLEEQLADRLDDYDKEYRDYLVNRYKEIGSSQFIEEFKDAGYKKMRMTDKEIHENNVRAANELVIDMYNRVEEITGDNITGWENISVKNGNTGCALNGIVSGNKGTAKIESIYAGGYNVQRLHIRVLVKKC